MEADHQETPSASHVRRRRRVGRSMREKTPDPSCRRMSSTEDDNSVVGGTTTSEGTQVSMQIRPPRSKMSAHESKILRRRDKTFAASASRSLSQPREAERLSEPEATELIQTVKRSLSTPRNKELAESSEGEIQAKGRTLSPEARLVSVPIQSAADENLSRLEQNLRRFENERKRFENEKKLFESERREHKLRYKQMLDNEERQRLLQSYRKLSDRIKLTQGEDERKRLINSLRLERNEINLPVFRPDVKRNRQSANFEESSTQFSSSDTEPTEEIQARRLAKQLSPVKRHHSGMTTASVRGPPPKPPARQSSSRHNSLSPVTPQRRSKTPEQRAEIMRKLEDLEQQQRQAIETIRVETSTTEFETDREFQLRHRKVHRSESLHQPEPKRNHSLEKYQDKVDSSMPMKITKEAPPEIVITQAEEVEIVSNKNKAIQKPTFFQRLAQLFKKPAKRELLSIEQEDLLPQAPESQQKLQDEILSKAFLKAFLSDARQQWLQYKARHPQDIKDIKRMRNRCFAHTIMLILLLGFGGLMFRYTEGTSENIYKCEVRKVKRDFIDHLWSHSHSMREDDWKTLARQKLRKFEEELHTMGEMGVRYFPGQKSWNFVNCILYCWTVITTIGYGHITPKTKLGQSLTIAYAIIGIPMFLILLADFGILFTRGIKFVWGYVRGLYYTGTCRRIRKQQQAELADVLRKRRNRPDASDEDLDLPRSPASPQRRATSSQHNATTQASHLASKQSNLVDKQNEVSSLSMLSMISNDGEDFLTNETTTTANTSITATETAQERVTATKFSRSSTTSSVSMSSDILRHPDASFDDTKDEVDLFSSDWQRLSHTAAKHKMAIRPIKKKGGPSRQHRRTLETSIPEANEDFNKFINKKILEVKDIDTNPKTRSLPPVVSAALHADELPTATKEPITKTTKTINSNTTLSTNTSNSTTLTATNMFGLRNLTAKASAMFDSKDIQQTEEVTNKSSDSPRKVEVAGKTSQPIETIETGFLRRLMQRNSKRSIAKVNAECDQDELDKKQNEPKKKQISSTSLTFSSSAYEKSKTEFGTFENTFEENRRETKQETYQEGKKIGQTIIVNSFALAAKDERKVEEKSLAKPKSGPAARQRYLPQNISNEDLVKINEERTAYKECTLPQLMNEAFQSTSLVREISKQQSSKSCSPPKIEHHFEKKPKIVGLSAFQQKVSRSNDSFGRLSANASLLSLDKSDKLSSTARLQTYEQKQRKSVERSRSFKAYGEQKDMSSSGSVHNNMPSLPDLSLSLRVPYYKDFISNGKGLSDEKYISLGIEVNANKLVQPGQESQKSFSSYDKNISIVNTSNCSAAVKTSPTKLSTAACNKNIFEIENNTDLMAMSPFVNILRKSTNLSEEHSDEVIKASPTLPTEKVRPTALSLLKEKSLSDENILNSPSTAAVMLREKPLVKANALFSSSVSSPTNEVERKSAPAVNGKTANGYRCNSTRRSSSIMESAEKPLRSNVPEFMKIQLNRVDPTRTSKGHVVLAKNVKEISSSFSRECSPEKNYCSSSMDDLSFRRLSNESVDIHERTSPPNEKSFSGPFHEAINKQAKICTGLPPRSPVKKTPTTPTTPPTPIINDRDSARDYCKFPETFENSPSNTNSLSLQERRRLFMNEERNKMDKKLEETRFERKKSLSEQVTKKCASRSESEQKEMNNKDLSPVDTSVVLRKKSFASSVHSLNGNSINSNSSNSNNNNSPNKDDSTPELMKVFARRSLKIKDEDLDKMLSSNGNTNLSAVQTLKKFTNPCSNTSVDSDKENQSASDEKLDKLPLLETNQTMNSVKSNNTQLNAAQITLNGAVSANNNNNRNSLADFRLGSCKISHSALSINNNSNNNNNGTSNGESCALNGGKTSLPPIKVNGGGLRAISIERNNNQNNALSPTKASTTLERSTIKLGDLGTSSRTDGPTNISKTIERSATMGEFKGIHQRRAEWEQRAKEALK